MPPLVASPLTELLISTDTWQLSTSRLLLSNTRDTSPAANFWLVVMVPVVCRLRMVAALPT